ncbi:MAG: GerMN domain-containing protein [Gaiellaceae bacterium]
MARYAVLAALLGLVGLAGCGGSSPQGSGDEPVQEVAGVTTQPSTGSTRTTVYFLTERGVAPVGARRTIQTKSPYAREALEALLRGPSDEERGQGVTTAIPTDTDVLSLTIQAPRPRGGSEAVVDLSGLTTVTDPIDKARVITQVARTLIGMSDIDRVTLRSDGGPWGLVGMTGDVIDGPFDYGTLAGWHLGSSCPGTETVECDRFDALP